MSDDDYIQVLYVVSTLRRCGPTSQLFEIIRFLDRDIFRPMVITLSKEPDNSARSEFSTIVPVHSLSLSRPVSVLWGPNRLSKVTGKTSVDVVHTQGIRADAVVALSRLHAQQVATIRNYFLEDYPMQYGAFRGRGVAGLHFMLLGLVDKPVACSESLSQRYRRLGMSTDAVLNGVDVDKFSPNDQKSARKILGLPTGERIFVYVGTLIERKAVDDIIDAFSALDHSGGCEAHLVIVGKGPQKEALEQKAEANGRIHFEGYSQKPRLYYQAADYSVSASRSEGLPNSVLESLACGTPVLLSDIEAHKEIKELCRRGCQLFKTGSVGSLRAEVRKLADLSRKDVVEAGARRCAENKLSSKRMSVEYQKIYKSLC